MIDLLGVLALFFAALLPFVLLIFLIATHQYAEGRSDPLLADWSNWVSSKSQPDWTRKRVEASFRRKILAASLPPEVVSLAEAYATGTDYALLPCTMRCWRPADRRWPSRFARTVSWSSGQS